MQLQDIKECINRENEGFPTVLLAPIIAHIIRELGTGYLSSIFPVVGAELFPKKERNEQTIMYTK